MRRAERAVRRMWHGDKGVGPLVLAALAAPPAAAFGTGVRIRNVLYDLGFLPSRRAPVPVISVGNLAIGGTGKTPVAAWVVGQLALTGWKPALVTRGYGEDEIRLHRRWNPDAPVIRTPRRIEGATRAHEEGRDVVVLDDGFQHRGIARDVDLVLLSPAHHLPARLLPRGPFREPLRALQRADHVLVTAKGEHEREPAERLADALSRLPVAASVDVFPFRIGAWQGLDGSPAEPPPGAPLAVTSVAEPGSFLRLVREAAREPVAHLAFPDHHPFDETDAERIRSAAGEGWVATTEKDAVKLGRFQDHLPNCRVLPLVPDPRPDLGNRIIGRLKPIETGRKGP